MTFDLSAWRGRTLQIYMSVYNDGRGGTAAMFLDDVSLLVCGPNVSTATPECGRYRDVGLDPKRGAQPDPRSSLWRRRPLHRSSLWPPRLTHPSRP